MKSRILIFFAVFLLLIASQAEARPGKDITSQKLIWVRYGGNIIFNKTWTIGAEIEDRRFAFPDRQHQLLFPRLTLLKKLGNGWEAGIGYVNFRQSMPQDGSKQIEYIRPEFRFQEELSFIHPIGTGKWKLAHRYGLEERFIHKSSEGVLTPGYQFNFRFRYRAQVVLPLVGKAPDSGSLILKIFDELFLNVGRTIVYNTFDQNRMGFGLNYGLTKNLQAEVSLFNWFQQQTAGDNYYNRIIAGVALYQTFNLNKQ